MDELVTRLLLIFTIWKAAARDGLPIDDVADLAPALGIAADRITMWKNAVLLDLHSRDLIVVDDQRNRLFVSARGIDLLRRFDFCMSARDWPPKDAALVFGNA